MRKGHLWRRGRWLRGWACLVVVLGSLLLLGRVGRRASAGLGDGMPARGPVYIPLVMGGRLQPPPPPQIEFFRATPETIAAGECAILEWGAVTGATEAVIEPGIGGVATPGSQTVCPAQTTEFVLTATGPGGVTTASATVTVQPGPPPEGWDPRLDELGVFLEPAPVDPDEAHWALVEARWADPIESAGLHHIFFEVLDADGTRFVGQTVVVAWATGSVTLQIEDKPPPEYGANFPMSKGNTLGSFDAWVDGGEPSDRVTGMGLGTANEPDVNHHTSFYLTFQWVPGSEE
jgi:hypothetical protein